jgi:hypothetical protein
MNKVALVALLALVAVVFLPGAQAQMRGGTVFGQAGSAGSFRFGGPVRGFVRGVAGERGEMRHSYRTPLVLGSSFFYGDYATEPASNESSPQIIVVQVPAEGPKAAEEPAKVESLLIERQGDHYVELGTPQAQNGGSATTTAAAPAYGKPAEVSLSPARVQPPAPKLQPVVLVFRDGHREEVRDYTIADGILYASGDYWTDGYWTKKIPLAALNLPCTQQASQQHGAQFVLPRFANEVIVRP